MFSSPMYVLNWAKWRVCYIPTSCFKLRRWVQQIYEFKHILYFLIGSDVQLGSHWTSNNLDSLFEKKDDIVFDALLI